MAKYKVICLSVSGVNNKVYKSGDIISADGFNEPIQKLMDGKYIEEVPEEEAKPAVEEATEVTTDEPAPETTVTQEVPEEEAKPAKKKK